MLVYSLHNEIYYYNTYFLSSIFLIFHVLNALNKKIVTKPVKNVND